MSRSRGVPSSMPVPHLGHLDDRQRSSTWKLTIRRIKRGLFSSKKIEQDRSLQPAGTFPPAEHDAAPATRLPQNKTSSLSSRGSRFRRRQTGLNGVSQPREKPSGPREPHDSKGFNLIKDTLSRSKKSAPPSSYQIMNNGGILREGTIAQGIQMPENHLQTQKKTAREDGTTEVMRPRTAGYVPRHAGRDIAQSIQQTRPLQPPANLSRHTASYMPKHAASDFSRMNMMPAVDPARSNKFSYARIQFERPATAVLPPQEPQLDSMDYQRFLVESREAHRSHGKTSHGKETPSEVSKVMDDFTARHHVQVRERTLSISQLSTTSRPSRPPSFVEKLGEYIKPSRPGSVYSQRFFEGDDKSSMKGSVETGQERWEMRWARVGSSIRRSLSRNRDSDGDKIAGKYWGLETETRVGETGLCLFLLH